MVLGIIYALIWVWLSSTMNIISKLMSQRYDVDRSLVIQYFFGAMIALMLMILIDGQLYTLTYVQWAFMILLGFIWYVDYRCFYKALSKLHAGTVMIISSLTIFLSYGINIFILPETTFSVYKTIIGLLFVIVIIISISTNKSHGHLSLHHILHSLSRHYHIWSGSNQNSQTPTLAKTWYIRAIISTVMASLLYVWLWYGLEKWFISAWQATALPDTFTLIIAVRVYGEHNDFWYRKFGEMRLKSIVPYIIIGLFGACNSVLIYTAIQYSDPNTIAIVRLTGIILTPILAQIILHDKLTRIQRILSILWFVLMILFIMDR